MKVKAIYVALWISTCWINYMSLKPDFGDIESLLPFIMVIAYITALIFGFGIAITLI